MPGNFSIIPKAEPFLYMGGQTGILLVHGFTGTPYEMHGMGKFFADQGHTVLGIRLPGHATKPEDLPHFKWHDWLCAVEDGYDLLHSAGCRVFIMGLSMGGILTLTAASRLPIAGAVAMSAPYRLPPDPRLPYAQYLAWLMPSVPKGPAGWQDLSAAEGFIEYPAFLTRGIAELRDLLEEMRRTLPQIRCPVLLIHSRTDCTATPDNLEMIFAALGTQDKTALWLEKSGHVVTCDLEHPRVFTGALEFVQRLSSEPTQPG